MKQSSADGSPGLVDGRASALRSKVFILAKACSIGLRSGEEAGRKKSLALAARMAARTARPLWLPRLSHDDNIAGREDRDENLLDISAEAHAIDRSVDDAGRGEAVATQRRQEREGSPSPEGRFGDEAFASGASAMGARHVGLGPGLVDEDKPPRIDPRLSRLPPFTPPGDVRSVLFGGAKAFF